MDFRKERDGSDASNQSFLSLEESREESLLHFRWDKSREESLLHFRWDNDGVVGKFFTSNSSSSQHGRFSFLDGSLISPLLGKQSQSFCNCRTRNEIFCSCNRTHRNILYSCHDPTAKDSFPSPCEHTSNQSRHKRTRGNKTNVYKELQNFHLYMKRISLLSVILLLAMFVPLTLSMSPPPNYSQSNMPKTNFTCSDKATGGYYADPEAECQMFHVCVRISDDEMNDFRFLCPNDTVFDQQNFICTNWWEIDCERSTRYYSKNDLFRVNDHPPEYEYESVSEKENLESPVYYEYVYEYGEPNESTQKSGAETVSPTGNHRLSFGKSSLERPMARAVETTYLESPTDKTVFKETTKSLFLEASTSTVIATTFSPSPQRTSYKSTSVNSFQNSESFTQKNSEQTTTSKTTSNIPHRLAFNSVLTSERSVSEVNPSNAFKIQRFNSREGSPFKGKEVEETTSLYQNGTSKPIYASDDPFASYDWKRDSTGVTASARTRYETLFGETRRRERNFTPNIDKKEDIKEKSLASNNEKMGKNDSLTGKQNPSENQRKRRKQNRQSQQQKQQSTEKQQQQIQKQSSQQQDQKHEQQDQSQQDTTPKPRRQRLQKQNEATNDTSATKAKHEAFSNFRFYKTAFGRSYSSDDFLGSSEQKEPHNRVSEPVLSQRTASRNTRYSIYG